VWIANKGYDPFMGARPLSRVIQDQIEDKLSDAILEGRFSPGDTAIIGLGDDEIKVDTQQAPVEEPTPA
jgi:ATP-dependent Clp protease ATP-binding subunit ClpA